MLRYLIDAEEYLNRTRAGSNLKAIEELQLFGLGYRFIDISQHDIDHFPEEERAEEIRKRNPSVIIPNVDRVSLTRIVNALELLFSQEEESLEDYMTRLTKGVNPLYN